MTTIEPDIPESTVNIDSTFLCKICIIVLLGLNLTDGQMMSLLI